MSRALPIATALRPLPAVSPAGDLAARRVEYLRLSVTDRCNERCLYCLPENFSDWTPRGDLLTDDEMLAVVDAAVLSGFRHFRITGGEPLLRAGIVGLIGNVVRRPGVESVQVTTNGTRLAELAQGLHAAGLRRINVSLDALDPDVYRAITRGDIAPVLAGLARARELGFHLKLNMVLMRGRNDSQIWPLVRYAAEHDLPLRFIELMPVSLTEMLDESNFLPVAEVKAMLAASDTLTPLANRLGHGPAKYFRLEKHGATLGFIGALTDLHFCDQCNKVRVTADGKIRPCLGDHGELDLKPALRPAISGEALHATFARALAEKPATHLFRDSYQPGRIMTAIGG